MEIYQVSYSLSVSMVIIIVNLYNTKNYFPTTFKERNPEYFLISILNKYNLIIDLTDKQTNHDKPDILCMQTSEKCGNE